MDDVISTVLTSCDVAVGAMIVSVDSVAGTVADDVSVGGIVGNASVSSTLGAVGEIVSADGGRGVGTLTGENGVDPGPMVEAEMVGVIESGRHPVKRINIMNTQIFQLTVPNWDTFLPHRLIELSFRY